MGAGRMHLIRNDTVQRSRHCHSMTWTGTTPWDCGIQFNCFCLQMHQRQICLLLALLCPRLWSGKAHLHHLLALVLCIHLCLCCVHLELGLLGMWWRAHLVLALLLPLEWYFVHRVLGASYGLLPWLDLDWGTCYSAFCWCEATLLGTLVKLFLIGWISLGCTTIGAQIICCWLVFVPSAKMKLLLIGPGGVQGTTYSGAGSWQVILAWGGPHPLFCDW